MGQPASKPPRRNPYPDPNGDSLRRLLDRVKETCPQGCYPAPPPPPIQQTIRTAHLDETPIWLKRQWENEKISRIYQLPEEIVILIRDHSDYPTRILLRQSCSLFLRIVSDLDRARSPDINDNIWKTAVARYFNGRLLFPLHGTAQEFQRRRHEWRDLVYRDITLQLCSSCRPYRRSAEYNEKLRKLGEIVICGWRCCRHARFLQAREENDPEHVECIVHSGRVSLCSHTRVTRRDLRKVQFPSEGPLGIGSRRNEILCYDSEHWTEPARVDGVYWPPFITTCNNETVLSWVSPAFDLDPRVPFTRQHLKDMLRTFNVAGNLQFCPHVHAQDERLILPFEPDQCACFDYDTGNTAKPLGGQFHHHDPENGTGNCCRCYSEQHPEGKGIFLPAGTDPVSVRELNAGALHEYKCPQCYAVYAWMRGTGDRVYLRCRRTLDTEHLHSLVKSTTNEWALLEDQDTYQITWCHSRDCITSTHWTRLYTFNKTSGAFVSKGIERMQFYALN